MNDPRTSVLLLLEAGYVTQAEAAVLAGVTRQSISHWVRKAKIQPVEARAQHLHQLYKHARRHDHHP